MAGQKITDGRNVFLIHEIGRIDGGKGFRTRGNVFRIGGNTFYDRKNIIPLKILEFKRSGIGLIAEFRGIPNGFPNQVCLSVFFLYKTCVRREYICISNPLDLVYTYEFLQ
jgi:hypothetical protein